MKNVQTFTILPNHPEIIGFLFLRENRVKKIGFYIITVLLGFIPLFILHLVPDYE